MNKGTEIYRSFEGKLDYENQGGYIIYDYSENYFLVDSFSVFSSTHNYVLINKNIDFDFENESRIAEIEQEVENGTESGAVMVNGKWYYQKQIVDLQKKYQDYRWRLHL